MPEILELELAKAADVLVRGMLKIKRGENFLITVDTEGDWRVAEATAKAAMAVDAKVALLWHATPLGVGEAADPYIPKPLEAAIQNCDVWVEYNMNYIYYSTPYQKIYNQGRMKIRYMCLAGLNVDMMVRCIGRVNIRKLAEFQNKLTEITKNADEMRITTHAGTDIRFENDPSRGIDNHTGMADKPTIPHMLPGQIGWQPIEETINGTLVFDGSLTPPIGILRSPVKLTVKEGKVARPEGGVDAKTFETWLASFDDPAMYNVAHICYGCNPGARLSGNIIEDERVWGVVEWGLGFQEAHLGGKAGPAKSHTDGICLNPSIWLDNVQIEKEGRYIEPELARLAKGMGMT